MFDIASRTAAVRVLTVLLILSAMAVGGTNFAPPASAADADYHSLAENARPDWMRDLPDESSLAELSVPGTHDTLAVYGGSITETQESHHNDDGIGGDEIGFQLGAGIRALDIRVRIVSGEDNKARFAIHHGAVYQNANFDDVLREARTFLNAHPEETILLNLKAECDGGNCKDDDPCTTCDTDLDQRRQQIFNDYRNENPGLFWSPSAAGTGDVEIPTLGEVRGKITLVNFVSPQGGNYGNYGMEQLNYATWAVESGKSPNCYVQNTYKVTTIADINDKWELAHDLLGVTNRPNDCRDPLKPNDDKMYLNFTSASTGAYPSTVAGGTPTATGVNGFLYQCLTGQNNRCDTQSVRRTGVVMMDYPGDGLVGEIIRRNYWLADRDIRLMPLGDSITQGSGSSTNSGYRAPLWEMLNGTAKTVDFVGSRQLGSLQDRDHQGQSGRRIDEIAQNAACDVPSRRPNVVTLHAGTNDMNQEHDLTDAPARMGALIDQILRAAPETTVLVASVIPASKAGLQPRIDAFNQALTPLVQERSAAGEHVALVDMSAVTTADLPDGVHPNDAGYAKMARAYFRGIRQAEQAGWIQPAVQGTNVFCPPVATDGDQDEDGTALGDGWRALGVIAPGMDSPTGRTDIVELDGDDRGDYVRIANDGSVRAALNTPGSVPGKPDWVEQGTISPGRGHSAEAVRFADVTGDGRDDYLLVGTEGSVRAWQNNGPGAADGPYHWTDLGIIAPGVSGTTREALRFADVDGDGRDDYLRTSDSGAVHAYLNTPTSAGAIHWTEHLHWAPGVSYGTRDKLRLADVNGDRRADYLMVDSTGRTHAYINDGGGGAGGFTPHMNYSAGYGDSYPGEHVTFRDISGDGKADCVVIYDAGSVRAWLNRGGNLPGTA
ncbi:phosphatidylinositol-specific phospholipase C domain-containing protein [Streptomyces finlayi]|nr:phosphatidylinositol-specific phospholipase C domain-containing protein [Streptomyces finlayi]